MANKSKIQWTDATVNFWTGCQKVSPGCKYCYMYRGKSRFHQDPTKIVKADFDRIRKALQQLEPGSKIFVCSWSDFFIEEADEWRQEAWDIIGSHRGFIWQILTKRPERILQSLPSWWFEDDDNNHSNINIWLGVSAENQAELEKRLPLLQDIPLQHGVRFVSFEPVLGEIQLTPDHLKVIDWAIIGGESGNDTGQWKYRKMEHYWLDILVARLQTGGVPTFIKQLGTGFAKELKLKDRHGGDWEEWPDYLKIRQWPRFIQR